MPDPSRAPLPLPDRPATRWPGMPAMPAIPALLALLLCGCVTKAPAPVVVAPPPVVVVAPEPVAPPDRVAPLLDYHQTLRRMTQGELQKELGSLNQQSRSPRVALQTGMVLMLTRGAADLARAQSLLDSVANASDEYAQPYRALAQLLSSNCAEARRLAEHVDRLNAHLRDNQRDSQRRIDQLSDMVEGLKAIERKLPALAPARPAQTVKR